MKNKEFYNVGDVLRIRDGYVVILSEEWKNKTSGFLIPNGEVVVGKTYSSGEAIESRRASIVSLISTNFPELDPQKIEDLANSLKDPNESFVLLEGDFVVTHVERGSGTRIRVDCKRLSGGGKWDTEGVEILFYPLMNGLKGQTFPKTGREMKIKFE